ncbi:MAG: SseB protein C-terminal domain, partial [Candidatus Parcubacteria bacterium]
MGLFDFFKKPSFIPHQTIVIDTETNVSIGQPAVYPTQIIEVLRNLFKNEPGVNAAY